MQSATLTITQALAAAATLGLQRLDAQMLLLHTLSQPLHNRAWLLAHGEALVSPDKLAAYLALASRQRAGEPLAYLTGQQAFYGLDLQVDPRVLVPRADTETLVDWALEVYQGQDHATDVLDLGTGSGAVALAIQQARPSWRVWASDAGPDALAVARANAERLNLPVHFLQGDWFEALKLQEVRAFNLIVSNPPYIAQGDAHLPALRHEPAQALTSGTDGLDAIREIIAGAATHLLPGGWLLLEHGYDQAAQVRELLERSGFGGVQSRRDLAGIERCSGGRTATERQSPQASKPIAV